MTDAELARDATNGDTRAFSRLADRHAPAAIRFATRMLGNREDAEEAVQEALLRAYRALPGYDERVQFRTWLFAILANRCRTAYASRRRRQRWVRDDPMAVEAASVSGTAEDAMLRVELFRALDRLGLDQREAFLLKHVEQLEYTEMAAITGVTISALKMRVQRACRQLQDDLREYNHER